MQPAHRNFLVASLGVVVVLGPVEPGFAQPVILSAPSGTFAAEHAQPSRLAQTGRSHDSQTWDINTGAIPLAPPAATDEIWLDWRLAPSAAELTVTNAATTDEPPNVAVSLMEPQPPEISGLEWVPTTPKAKMPASVVAAGINGPNEVEAAQADLAQADEDEVIDPDLPDVEPGEGVIDPALPDADTEDIDLDPDDERVNPVDPLEDDPEDSVLDADPFDQDALDDESFDGEPFDDEPFDDEPFDDDNVEPDGVDVDADVVPDPEEPIVDPQPEEIDPPGEELDEELEEPGSAEDLELDDPDLEFDDTVESLRSPANPLFFPTDPDALEVGAIVPLSLDQALEIARLNSREYEVVRLQLEQARAALREQRATLFPTISFQGTLTRTQTTRFTDDLDGDGFEDVPFDPDTVNIDPFTGNVAGGDPVEINNLDNDFTATFSLDYDIFTFGERRALIRAAQEAVRLQELQLEVVSEEIRLATAEAYYDLQDTDELVRIAEDTLEESLISLRDARAREEAGVGTRFDRLQAEVDVANSQQDLREAISNQLTAQRLLADLLSLPPGIVITAADPVEVAGVWELSLEQSVVLAYKNRAELEQQLVQRELDQQQRRAAIAAIRPQLSFFTNYQINDFLDVTRSTEDIEQWQFGLQLSWLLFDGGAARARARQEDFDVAIAESDFADTREEIRFEVEEAFFSLESNFENIQTAAAAVELAEESLRLARLRFQAGVGIQSDVIQAQTDLTEAEVNLVDAILGYNRALVNIERAVSNLPNNNLTDVP